MIRKRYIILITTIVTALFLNIDSRANDGAFYASGNQLIPITETSISVKKEILTLTKISDKYLEVSVYYELYNPGKTKMLLVGFEALSPNGDVDGTPRNGKHPYIEDFTVNVNGKTIGYKTAIVTDNNYYINNRMRSKSVQQVLRKDFNRNYPDFFYVYYFKPVFKSGTNVIKHFYRFRLSGSVMTYYDFNYVLTAVNRWANNGIDDFTLVIQLDPFESFSIKRSFFKGINGWYVDGKIVMNVLKDIPGSGSKQLEVFSKNGKVIFKKKNFKPAGELSISKGINFPLRNIQTFNYKEISLPFSVKDSLHITGSYNFDSYRVLRNLPFARRGYIFKSALIQKYYESRFWYMPDKDYKAKLSDLQKDELKWLGKVKKMWENNH